MRAVQLGSGEVVQMKRRVTAFECQPGPWREVGGFLRTLEQDLVMD